MTPKEKIEKLLEDRLGYKSIRSYTHDEIITAMQLAYNRAIEDAAESATMVYHDGYTKNNYPTKHHQSGADNIQVDKQSILKLKI